MQKFENVDILACLDAVMKQNTGFYQSDFEIDKEIIHKAAASPDREVGGHKKVISYFLRNGVASVTPFPVSAVLPRG